MGGARIAGLLTLISRKFSPAPPRCSRMTAGLRSEATAHQEASTRPCPWHTRNMQKHTRNAERQVPQGMLQPPSGGSSEGVASPRRSRRRGRTSSRNLWQHSLGVAINPATRRIGSQDETARHRNAIGKVSIHVSSKQPDLAVPLDPSRDD